MTDMEPVVRKARQSVRRRLPALMARIDWPRARLDEYREQAVRAVLTHAMERSGEAIRSIASQSWLLMAVAGLSLPCRSELARE